MADAFKPCAIDDCNGNAHYTAKGARGWCAKHYARYRLHGDPLAGRTPVNEIPTFFRDVVLQHVGNDCLIWPYATNSGYAVMSHEGAQRLVSRLICLEKYGEPPTPRHEAAHACGKGHQGCVSPSHLSWKTPIQNAADKNIHGTQIRGEDCLLSKLTAAEVQEIRRRVVSGEYHREVAAAFGVARVTVTNIMNGKSWAWLEDGVAG